MANIATKKDLRIFAVALATAVFIWSIIFQWLADIGWLHLLPFLALSVLLLITARFSPLSLRSTHRVWMKLAHGLNVLISWTLMSFIFFCIITPVAFVLKIVGYNALFNQHTLPGSYRTESKAISRTDMENPF